LKSIRELIYKRGKLVKKDIIDLAYKGQSIPESHFECIRLKDKVSRFMEEIQLAVSIKSSISYF
jgi:hypothetical protein